MERVDIWMDDGLVGEEPARVGQLRVSAVRGRMALRFRYDPRWLARGASSFPIDPELPLGEGDFFPAPGRTLHGALRDTSPDRWGRRLMDRRERDEATQERRQPRALTEWDYLLGVQDLGRLGGLRLRDPERGRWLDDRTPGIPPITRLRELEAAADRIDAEPTAVDPAIASLIQPGSSLGGARPKATFLDPDGSLWLAKFPSREDRLDVGAAESLLHQLARASGVDVPPSRLEALGGRGSTFCVQRFDRQGAPLRGPQIGLPNPAKPDFEAELRVRRAEITPQAGNQRGTPPRAGAASDYLPRCDLHARSRDSADQGLQAGRITTSHGTSSQFAPRGRNTADPRVPINQESYRERTSPQS